MTDDKTVEAVWIAALAASDETITDSRYQVEKWKRIARAAIEAHEAAKGERVECDGGPHCKARPHFHGCFADTGNCDDPGDHAPDPLAVGETEREALAGVIKERGIEWSNSGRHTITSVPNDAGAGELADRILAAGFHRHPTPAPVVVEKVEELEALPVGTVVRDFTSVVCEKWASGWCAAGPVAIEPVVGLPATVLTPATRATVSAEQVAAIQKDLHYQFDVYLTTPELVDLLRTAGLTVEEGN